jgi:large subunit ribosomal protein L7/L12
MAEEKKDIKKEEKPAEKKPAEKKEEKKEVEIPEKFKSLVSEIEKMSVLDLAELVKILEEKFGVSASAPVAMMVAPGAGGEGAGAAEEKSSFNVELKEAGAQKIAVIKVVKEITGKGLQDAKKIVDSAPVVIKENAAKAEAEELKKKLEGAGAVVELK